MIWQQWSWSTLMGLTVIAGGCATSPDNKTVDAQRLSQTIPGESLALNKSTGKPSPRLNLAYGRLQEQRGNAAEARASYEKVLVDSPKSVDAILGLARLDHLAGRTSEAEHRYQEALRLENRSPRTLDAIGQFYTEESRWNEAQASFQQALQAAPEDKTYHYHLATALAKSGQVERATPHFVQAVGEAAAHYNIGLILHERGDIATCEQHFMQAVIKDPHLEQAQFWLDELRKGPEGQHAVAVAPTSRPKAERTLPAAPQIVQQVPVETIHAPPQGAVSAPASTTPVNEPRIVASAPAPKLDLAPQRSTANKPQSIATGNSTPMPQTAFAPQARPQYSPPTPPAGSRTTAAQQPPANFTQQQWEQWQNQQMR